MDNALQHYIFMYVYIFEVLEAGVFKDFRVVCFSLKYKSFVKFSKQKISTVS